jgi:nucleoside-triphosphatase
VPKNLFISGTPGVGKTTLIKETTLPYRGRVSGFYTEELREGSERKGFAIKSFAPEAGPGVVFAKKGMKSPHKVGKYGVDVPALERAVLPSLEAGTKSPGRLIVVDEIGSMEAHSGPFREKLLACLQSSNPVLATIRHNSQPFTDHVKKLADTELVRLTRDNFPDVKEKVRRWLAEKLG